MKRIQIVGIPLLLAGFLMYFLIEREPYTTIAGLIGGTGLGLILFGPKITSKSRK